MIYSYPGLWSYGLILLLYISVDFAACNLIPQLQEQILSPEADHQIPNSLGVLSRLVSYIFKSREQITDRAQSVKVISQAIRSDSSTTSTTVSLTQIEQQDASIEEGTLSVTTTLQKTLTTMQTQVFSFNCTSSCSVVAHCYTNHNIQVKCKIGQLQRRFSSSRNTVSEVSELCNSILSVTKHSILGAFNADTQNNMAELLTVPFVINHKGMNTSDAGTTTTTRSSSIHCTLCGNELTQQITSAVCLVCETQAFILFSFGLALSSPSQRSCRMKLHDVLVPEGHYCLIPEWSNTRQILISVLDGKPSCSCSFCKVFISGGAMDCSYLERDCGKLIEQLMQYTNDRLREITKSGYSWLRLFKRSQTSGQILWNDQVKGGELEQQEQNLQEIIKYFLPSVHTVRKCVRCFFE